MPHTNRWRASSSSSGRRNSTQVVPCREPGSSLSLALWPPGRITGKTRSLRSRELTRRWRAIATTRWRTLSSVVGLLIERVSFPSGGAYFWWWQRCGRSLCAPSAPVVTSGFAGRIGLTRSAVGWISRIIVRRSISAKNVSWSVRTRRSPKRCQYGWLCHRPRFPNGRAIPNMVMASSDRPAPTKPA
jgi:hypothetical protein